jgi:hypothetical protein
MQDSLPQDDAARIGAGAAESHDPAAGDTGPGQTGFQDQHQGQDADAAPQDRDAAEPDAGPGSDGVADDAAVLDAMAAVDPEAARALQAAWGEDLAANLDLARKAARAFASPELKRALEDSGLGDHPALIRVAAEVGRLLDAPEAAPAASGTAPGLDAATLEALEAEIDQLHALQFARPQEYRSERTQRILARLYARRYGRERPAGPLGRRL